MLNTDINTRKEELKALITAWADENKLLKPGQVIEMDVRIKDPDKVKVTIEGYEGLTDINLVKVADIPNLSVRAMNCFANAGIETIGDLRKTKLQDLLKIRNTGKWVLRETESHVKELGVELGWNIK